MNDEYERMWKEAIVIYFKIESPILILNINQESSPRIADFRAEN
jgi:hypothetical protein